MMKMYVLDMGFVLEPIIVVVMKDGWVLNANIQTEHGVQNVLQEGKNVHAIVLYWKHVRINLLLKQNVVKRKHRKLKIVKYFYTSLHATI